MEKQDSITNKLEKLLENETFNRGNNPSLSNVYRILEKHNLLTKTEYTLPLKDTIGRVYFERIQFVN